MARKKQPFPTRLTSLSMQGYAMDDEQKCGVYGALEGEQVVAVPLRKKKESLVVPSRTDSVTKPGPSRA